MQVCRLVKLSTSPVRPLYCCVPLRCLSSLSFISRLFGVSASEPKPKKVPDDETVHGVELQEDFSWLKYRGSKVSKNRVLLGSGLTWLEVEAVV